MADRIVASGHRSAGHVMEYIECPDSTVLTVRADGEDWSWTCAKHGSAYGNQQRVSADADYHKLTAHQK